MKVHQWEKTGRTKEFTTRTEPVVDVEWECARCGEKAWRWQKHEPLPDGCGS